MSALGDGMGKKKSPKSIPRTQADVDKAFDKGMMAGSVGALTIMLYVLKDKFQADDAQLKEFSEAFDYVADSMAKGYITQADLKTVIKEEYHTVLRLT